MRDGQCKVLASLLFLSTLPQIAVAAQSDAPPPQAVRTATVAVITNFRARCPELKRADPGEEAVAIVVFRVGMTGVPSDASLRSSSHSESLDAAATSCVMKLRFQPATSPGNGEAVASWQQMALRWLRPSAHDAAAGGTASAGPAPPAQSMPAQAPAPTPAALQPHEALAPADARVDIGVCVDGSGKLAQPPTVTRSSGDAQFDAAALRVARSASGSYLSRTGVDHPARSACVPLTLSIEQRSRAD